MVQMIFPEENVGRIIEGLKQAQEKAKSIPSNSSLIIPDSIEDAKVIATEQENLKKGI